MSNIDECYANTNVLVNKLNIRDKNKLQEKEDKITGVVTQEITMHNAINGNLDFIHLKEIHNALFSSLYTWAGKERTVNISKGFFFCEVGNIPAYSKEIFTKLKKNNFYQGMNLDSQVDNLTSLYDELNCLHPFREGNGRANKIFLQYIAGINGFNFDFDEIPKDYWNKASQAASMGDSSYLRNALYNSVSFLTEEQTNFYRKASNLELINNSKHQLTTTKLLPKMVYDFVKGYSNKEELVSKKFEFENKAFIIQDIDKTPGKAQAEAVIKNCETQECFLEKNFAGSNPFKLALNKPVKTNDLKAIKNSKFIMD